MSPTITNTFFNAVTPLGLQYILSNGFGIEEPIPDTAAFVLGPSTLLNTKLLASYTLAELQLDPASSEAMTGLFVIVPPDKTGLCVVTWTVTLTVSPNTSPIGIALYNSANDALFFLCAFPPSFSLPQDAYDWNGMITLGINQCSS